MDPIEMREHIAQLKENERAILESYDYSFSLEEIVRMCETAGIPLHKVIITPTPNLELRISTE